MKVSDFGPNGYRLPSVEVNKTYRSHDLIVELGNRVIELNRGHQIEKRVIAHRSMPDDAVARPDH